MVFNLGMKLDTNQAGSIPKSLSWSLGHSTLRCVPFLASWLELRDRGDTSLELSRSSHTPQCPSQLQQMGEQGHLGSPLLPSVEQKVLALDAGSRNPSKPLGVPSSAGCSTTCNLHQLLAWGPARLEGTEHLENNPAQFLK